MPSHANVLTAGPGLFVARQPILDRARRVRGYEIQFRSTASARTAAGASADVATASVIEGLLAIGFETLTGGHRAFVRISRGLLLDGISTVLPADRIVWELGPDMPSDTDVLRACRELKGAGYSLALDRVSPDDGTSPLLPFADFLKMSLKDRPPVHSGTPSSDAPAIIVTEVETALDYHTAADDGYGLFQGFFLGKPTLKAGRALQAQHVSGLRLLHALQDPDLTILQLEDLVKHDATTCFLILRTINSAGYALRTTVTSIHDALILLGRDTVRRWAQLWALAGLGRHAHNELLTMATVRARCCELLAASSDDSGHGAEGFMVGLCSLLDAILEQPMPVVLASAPLAGPVKDALLGVDNPPRRTLDCVLAYERGEWDECVALAAAAGVNASVLPQAFAEALSWSTALQQGAAR